MTPRSWSFGRRYHDHATKHTSPTTAIAAQTIVTGGELDSQWLDFYPCVQFGEIDADAAFTGTCTHVHRGTFLRLTQASLQPCLRPVTDRALVKKCRTLVGGPHGEPSWHRFEPRLERRYIHTSHFDEAVGRCRPGGSGKELYCTSRRMPAAWRSSPALASGRMKSSPRSA